MTNPAHLPKRSPARRQRGVAAVISAIAVVALLAALALAVDVGQLFYAQRDLEREASLAAIAGAQTASGCRTNSHIPGGLNAAKDAVNYFVAQNPPSGGATLPAALVETGWVNDRPNEVLTGAINHAILFTAPSDGTRSFFPLSDSDSNLSPRIKAVRVTLTRSQPTPLIPFLSGASSTSKPQLSASAVAEQQALGSFFIGTTLATLSTSQSPLFNSLLCGNGASCLASLSISAAGYQGLLNTKVTLGQIAAAAGVKDLSNLLTTTTTLPGILGGLSPIINTATSGTGSSVSGLLASANSGNVVLGDILSNASALDPNATDIDLLDLLLALAEDATANSNGGLIPISLPTGLNLPPLINTQAFLKIGSPAQLGGPAPAGVAKATTAEATLMVRIQAGSLLSSLSTAITTILKSLFSVLDVLHLVTTSVTLPKNLNIGVDVVVAPASATLDTLQCPDATLAAPVAGLSVETSIASVAIGTFDSSNLTAPVSTTNSIPLATVSIDASGIGLGKTTQQLSLGFTSAGVGAASNYKLVPITLFHTPTQQSGSTLSALNYVAQGFSETPASENPQTVGSPANLALNFGVTATPVPPSSGLVGTLATIVTSLVSSLSTGVLQSLLTVLNSLASSVINPLLQLLGIQLGASTVTMSTVQTGVPVIVITSRVPLS